MYPLTTKQGKFYVGRIEVEATPIYLGLETTIEWTGEIPSLEQIIFELMYDLKKDENLDLYEANSYRCIVYDRKYLPGMKVLDGNVPPEGKRNIVLDFYNINPVN